LATFDDFFGKFYFQKSEICARFFFFGIFFSQKCFKNSLPKNHCFYNGIRFITYLDLNRGFTFGPSGVIQIALCVSIDEPLYFVTR
jgi:hypothetical protein